jgi:hypothetical protein
MIEPAQAVANIEVHWHPAPKIGRLNDDYRFQPSDGFGIDNPAW